MELQCSCRVPLPNHLGRRPDPVAPVGEWEVGRVWTSVQWELARGSVGAAVRRADSDTRARELTDHHDARCSHRDRRGRMRGRRSHGKRPRETLILHMILHVKLTNIY